MKMNEKFGVFPIYVFSMKSCGVCDQIFSLYFGTSLFIYSFLVVVICISSNRSWFISFFMSLLATQNSRFLTHSESFSNEIHQTMFIITDIVLDPYDIETNEIY